jgi:hypothetical protein
MLQESPNDLALMYLESNVVSLIDYTQLLSVFTHAKAHKIFLQT